MRLFLFMLFFCFALQSFGQVIYDDSPDYKEYIVLNNGSKYYGKVIKFTADTIRFEILGGHVLDIPQSLIKKHVQSLIGDEKYLFKKKYYAFREKGIFHRIDVEFLGAEDASDAPINGIGLDYTIGKSLHRKLRMGIGVGVHHASIGGRTYTLLPLFMDISGYTASKAVSPYYGIKLGKPIVLSNDSWQTFDTQDGWFVHPRFGVRVNGGAGATSHFVLGFKFAKMKQSIAQENWSSLRVIRAHRWTFSYMISF